MFGERFLFSRCRFLPRRLAPPIFSRLKTTGEIADHSKRETYAKKDQNHDKKTSHFSLIYLAEKKVSSPAAACAARACASSSASTVTPGGGAQPPFEPR